MLIKKLTDQEREFIEALHDPIILASVLFPPSVENLESLKTFDNEKYFKPRLYQLPMFSYEYLVANNDEFTSEENFELKQKAGTRYLYCGRKIGKTLVQLQDLLFDTIHNIKDWVTAFSSFDEAHVAGIIESYITVMKNHPFFRLFHMKVQRKYNRYTTKGHILEAVNMNLTSKRAGSNWERIHAKKIVIDEHQYETDDVSNKRSQSTSESGCIERFSGITSFKKHTPAGRIFYNISKKNWLVNIPQTISPFWNEKTKQQAIEDYGGEETIGYKVNILAEVCENALGVYDIERIRESYTYKRKVKHFEIDKDSFDRFPDLIIVEKPVNTERTWIAIDFGETAPTEITIFFEVNGLYRYEYNITLYRLVPDEQFEIVKYIAEKLEATFIGIDCTEEGGRQIYRDLSKIYPKENLVWVGFNENIDVDFEKDEEGNVIIKDGKPIWVKERTIDWSVRRLKTLLYNKKIEVPFTHKFDKQFNSIVCAQTKAGKLQYGHTEEDHLHASFQVFGIMEWKKAQIITKPVPKKSWGTGSFGKI